MKNIQAHLSLFFANLIYGANFTISKLVTPSYISPYGLVLFRVTGALVLFWIIGAFFYKEKMAKKDIFTCAWLAIVGVAVNQLLFIKGLSITSPINASIMMITSPILVMIFSVLVFKHKTIVINWVGVIIGFVGALVIILNRNFTQINESNWFGDLLILINAASWSIYLIYVRPLMMKYNTVTVVKWVFLFGFIYVLPIGYNQALNVQWETMNREIVWSFIYIIIGTTFFAYLLNTYALKKLSSSVAAAYIYIQPFLAALFGTIFFSMDTITINKVIGLLLVFAGVYMVSIKPVNNKKAY